MKPRIALWLSCVLGLLSCGEGVPTKPGDAPPGADDVVDFEKVLFNDDDEWGGLALGDPAWLLKEGRQATKEAFSLLRSVLGFVQEAVADDREPDASGVADDGSPWVAWAELDEGVEVVFAVVAAADGRRRYLLQARPQGGDEYKILMTGVFVKHASKRGGGRIHINMSAITDLAPEVDTDGRLHFWFANHNDGVIARRIAFRDVKPRTGDGIADNFIADDIQRDGVGGRARIVQTGDLIDDLDGVELLAMRLRWASGKGGRADAAIARIKPDVELLGAIHECWDTDGNRTAYSDTLDADDAAGDTQDPESCGGQAQEDVASADGTELDDEVTSELTDVGALDIDEADADLHPNLDL